MATFAQQISVTANDISQDGVGGSQYPSDLFLGRYNATTGMDYGCVRFTAVDAAQGSTVSGAALAITAREISQTNSFPLVLRVQGVLQGDLTAWPADVSALVLTEASADWSIPNWTPETIYTLSGEDLDAVLAEIFAQAEWAAGGAIGLVITAPAASPTTELVGYDVAQDPLKAAALSFDYEAPGGSSPIVVTSEAVTATEGETASAAAMVRAFSSGVAVEDEAISEPDVTLYVDAPADAVEDETASVTAPIIVTSEPVTASEGETATAAAVVRVLSGAAASEDEAADATAHIRAFAAAPAVEDERVQVGAVVRVRSSLTAVEDETASVSTGAHRVVSEPVVASEGERATAVATVRVFSAATAEEDVSVAIEALIRSLSSAHAVEDETASVGPLDVPTPPFRVLINVTSRRATLTVEDA